jgi:hypothetical protein
VRLNNSTTLYATASVIALIGAFLVFLSLCTQGISSGVNWLIAVGSGSFVAAGVVLTAAVKLHSEERDRAYRFLMENQKSQELLGALFFLARLRALNGILNVRQAREIYASPAPDYREVVLKVATACNFFEEMAIGVRARQTNEYILNQFYAGMLYRLGKFVEPLLPVIRNSPIVPGHPSGEVSKPEVYENMYWLYKRWGPAYEVAYFQEVPASRRLHESVILIAIIVAIGIVALHSFGCPSGSGCAYLLGQQ